MGLASGLETLCGQAYGAKQYHLLGIYLQRAIVILVLASIPISAIWLNMEKILLVVGEDAEIAHAAQAYVYWLIPILFLYSCLLPIIKFCQTQRAVFLLMICSAITLCVHVPLCWLVIDKLNVGYKGAAIAANISLCLNACLIVLSIWFSSKFEKTFPKFSKEAFQDFGEFFKLAIPSAIMMWLADWPSFLLFSPILYLDSCIYSSTSPDENLSLSADSLSLPWTMNVRVILFDQCPNVLRWLVCIHTA